MILSSSKRWEGPGILDIQHTILIGMVFVCKFVLYFQVLKPRITHHGKIRPSIIFEFDAILHIK